MKLSPSQFAGHGLSFQALQELAGGIAFLGQVLDDDLAGIELEVWNDGAELVAAFAVRDEFVEYEVRDGIRVQAEHDVLDGAVGHAGPIFDAPPSTMASDPSSTMAILAQTVAAHGQDSLPNEEANMGFAQVVSSDAIPHVAGYPSSVSTCVR